MNSGGGVECGRVLCCTLEGQKLGNLAVPERVHVLTRTAGYPRVLVGG